jgi:probable phosphoglycerate mutase
MTRLILIRHGQTDWNVEGRYQGQVDIPLNEHGREQAAQIARALSGANLAAIYASDLARAGETAKALAEAAGLQVRVDPRLREINQGRWEGRLFDEIRAEYPEELKRRRENPLAFAPPGGETVGQVKERVLAAIADVVHRHPTQSVAIVSHGLALALVRAYYGDYPAGKIWDLVPGNGEIVEIEAEPVEQV